MLISLDSLKQKYMFDITGILHAGAHLGEEAESYQNNGVTNVWWIEANPHLIPELEQIVAPYGHHVINELIAEEDGKEFDFKITNNGQSSSILDLHTHLTVSPDVWVTNVERMTAYTLDTICAKYGVTGTNLLNMDLQGSELLCLKGATETLKMIDYVYTEVNVDELYKDCARVNELDDYLTDFRRVETEMTPAGWGDGIYVRKTLL